MPMVITVTQVILGIRVTQIRRNLEKVDGRFFVLSALYTID